MVRRLGWQRRLEHGDQAGYTRPRVARERCDVPELVAEDGLLAARWLQLDENR
jgi:hypothetical protein